MTSYNQDSPTTTGAGDNFQIDLSLPRTELYRKSFCYYGCKQWNSLSETIKRAPYMESFKCRLKSSLISKYSATNSTG